MNLSPKQCVLAKYPKAYSEWVPGWGMWRIANCGAPETTGFTARAAWANASRGLKGQRPL